MRGRAGSVRGRHSGESRHTSHVTTPMAASAAHSSRWVVNNPTVSTSQGVRKDDRAVPPIPAPNTPVANPRRFAGYQAFTNGMPTANDVPATPRTKPHSSSIP